MAITELTKSANGRYSFHGGLPWRRELPVEPTKEAAYARAKAWCEDYVARDSLGNSANVLGVLAVGDGWCGVVNYYHSNT